MSEMMMNRATVEPMEDEPGRLATDAVPVRTVTPADADAIAQIDGKATGRARHEFFKRKIEIALRDPGVALSLAAEVDGRVVGFLLASVDYGEFGTVEPVAVLDAIGVQPEFRGKLVGRALMRQLVMNVRALNIERIRTEVDWRQRDLLGFFNRCGFAPMPRLCLEADVERIQTDPSD